MNIRRASNDDSNEIISLITSIYNEYGEIMYTKGADRDLLDIHENYHAKGGDFIVMVNEIDEIIGSHATLPINTKDGVLTLSLIHI